MTCTLTDRDAIGSWPDPHGCADEQGEGEGDGSRGTVSGGGEPPAAALGPPRILHRRLDAHPRFAVCCVVTT